MTAIKIISNPYKRIVEFRTLRQSTEEWVLVSHVNNPGSKLISEDIRTNFLPYKIKEIVDIIVEEYSVPGEHVKIIFEGSEDEYLEIAEVCKNYDVVDLERSDLVLENARNILPKIVDIFGEVKPIVDKSIQNEINRNSIDKDIAKLLDASNDIIPICVLGNYSSGKSTFINALMGVEILPSGDMPVTAKIYKIEQSHDENTAVVDFELLGEPIKVTISGDDFNVESESSSTLAKVIRDTLGESSGKKLAVKVNACLDAINKTQEGVSDLISIHIPFAKSPLGESNKSFVIFDTPGSNAATHKDHFSILEGAMKNLSNGIPIYVAEYNTLDSCDNETLYEKIKSISQIDSRFTMIVVNKADKANIEVDSFDQKMERDILKQAVPMNLYSGGIYFVSSFMGMGSKNDGEFINKYTAREYSKNHIDYEDDSSEWYQQLYKYNIMPQQIKESIVSASENAENKIFANSGLLAVEHEIVNFAEKYSAYDKCKQSDKYIGFIISATQDEIENNQTICEAERDNLQKELAEDKQRLIHDVTSMGKTMTDEFKSDYSQHMADCYTSEIVTCTDVELKALEREILTAKQNDVDYSEKQETMKESFGSIFSDISEGFGKKSVAEVIKTIGDDVRTTYEDAQTWRKSKVESDKATADELVRVVSDGYNQKGAAATKNIEASSRAYWESNVDKIKEALSLIVTNSPTLDDDKKQELAKIIINYTSVTFGEEHTFEKANFEKKLRLLGGYAIDLNKINTKKLAENYTKDFADGITKISDELRTGHADNFDSWLQELVDEITSNIVSYSPVLSEQAKKIEEKKAMIRELKNTRRTLENYSKQIQSLMDWELLS